MMVTVTITSGAPGWGRRPSGLSRLPDLWRIFPKKIISSSWNAVAPSATETPSPKRRNRGHEVPAGYGPFQHFATKSRFGISSVIDMDGSMDRPGFHLLRRELAR